MANDLWNGSGNWVGNPANWSLGSPPTSGETAEIQTGSAVLSSATTVAGLTIDPAATSLYLGRGAALKVSGNLVDNSDLLVASNESDGSVTVSIGGGLTGSGEVLIGNGGLTAPVTVTTASYGVSGDLYVYGSGAPGTADQGTLDIQSAAPTVLAANTYLAGDALLEYASGGIEAVAGGVSLSLLGSGARASIGAGTTSTALADLIANAGNLTLQGNGNGYLGGVDLSTSVGLTNIGNLSVDVATDTGGSDLSLGGALYNLGSASFGNYYLRVPTKISATSLIDNGNLALSGAAAENTNDTVTMDISGAAPLATSGNITLTGGAEIEFGSGNLEYVGPGDTILLEGAQAEVNTSSLAGPNSALEYLVAIEGTLAFEGDFDGETGGDSLSTAQSLINVGNLDVDSYGGAGGSLVNVEGTLDNYGVTGIGNDDLVASTTVTAEALVNGGNLTIVGSNQYESVDQATLDVEDTNYTTVTGNITLVGDALLALPQVAESIRPAGAKPDSGSDPGITSIGFGGSLTLEGAQARVALGLGTTNTGLEELALNNGVLNIEGDVGNGPGGVPVATVGLTNIGSLYVDAASGAGGSSLDIGGTLTNGGNLGSAALVDIGNPTLSAPTTVSANGLSTSGSIVLQGQDELDSASQALLEIGGAAPSAIAGYWYISGDALMQFASASIHTVDPRGSLTLDGGQAQISDSGGAFDSAIAALSANFGNLTIGGDAGDGAAAAAIALTGGLVTTGNLSIDAATSEGGSTVTVTGGGLVNSGVAAIGNPTLSANTDVTVSSLTNDFAFYLTGNTEAGGGQAVLDITGAAGLGAAGVVTGYMQVSGDSLLEFGSGGITTIAAYSTLALQTGPSQGDGFVAIAGNLTSNSALTGLASNYGVLGLAFGAVVSTTAGTTFTNDGTVEIDGFGGSDGGSALDIGGNLVNSGSFDVGGGYSQTIASTVTATALSNYGDLTLTGEATAGASITLSGAATNDGTVDIGADASLDAGTNAYVQYAGTTDVAGAINASAVNDEGGLIDFTSPLAGSGSLNIYGGAAMEFGAAASRAVTFKATTGTLELGAPGSFTGTITGFAGDDVIDLLGATVTGLSYSGGTLTVSGSSGTIASLAFSGSYTTSSFTYVSDGQGGADIILTPAVEWDGADGAWTSANWSSTPNSTDDAVLPGTAGYNVTVSAAIDVKSILVTDPLAILTIDAPSTTSTVGANIVNDGQLTVDDGAGEGGTIVDVTGAIDNARSLYIGNSDLGSATTVKAASLLNSGQVDLSGNDALAPSGLATLDITGAAPTVFTGGLDVQGDALVEFGSGDIAVVAAGAVLELYGANARISDGPGTTNSALDGLTRVAGEFDEEGDSFFGPGGVSVTTSAGLTVTGSLYLDEDSSDGGSSLSIGGALTVSGSVTVGNDALGGNTTLTATSLVDEASVTLWGSDSASPTSQATLDVTGAAPSELFGRLYVNGDALVEFASGGITTIAPDAELEVDGSHARLSDGAGVTNSALGKLATIAGTFDGEGDSSTGPGGASVSTAQGVTVTGNLDLDINSNDGGSTFQTSGALIDRGVVDVGNPTQGGNTTMDAATLANDGNLSLWGSNAATPTYQTTVDIAGAAPGTLTGQVFVQGAAMLEFGSGNITAIAAGSELQLDGAHARVSIGVSTASSALYDLASVAGTFDMEGDVGDGPGGAALTTSVAMTNNGNLDLDVGYEDGASTLTIGGALTNRGQVDVGNSDLGGDTTLSASALVNEGDITLQGNPAASATDKAALVISGNAAGAVGGDIIVRGDAALEFAAGSFTSIAAGAILELDGAQAVVTDGAGATNSALGNLSLISGELLIQGDSGYGAGAGNLSTGALTVTGQLLVDSASSDGGTHVTLSGALTNEGQVTIGNQGPKASTDLTATSITNRGVFDVYGSTGDPAQVTGSGLFNNYDTVSIAAGALVDLTGNYAQYAGSTTIYGNLDAAAVADQGGLIDFRSALTGTSTGTLEIYGAGTLEFDSSVATGNKLAFEASTGDLKLDDAAAFGATISGFSANDVIDLVDVTATSVAYSSGTLTVYDGATVVATLKFSGAYTTSSFLLASDDSGGTDILDPAAHASSHATAALLTQAMATFDAQSEAALSHAPPLGAGGWEMKQLVAVRA